MNNEGAVALPGRNRVDVWLMSLSRITDHMRTVFRNFLTSPELERMQRVASQSARDQHIAAWALLRTRLAQYTNEPPGSWIFERNRYGRPYIVKPLSFQGIQFNISHTDGIVACAVSIGHGVGVDVEDTTRDVDFIGLSKRFFSPLEAREVGRLEGEQARAAFFTYWTLKECYIKGCGKGLSMPLDAFWFDLSAAGPRLSCTDQCNDDPERWQFFQFAPTETHIVALAVADVKNVVLDIRLHWTDPQSLESFC